MSPLTHCYCIKANIHALELTADLTPSFSHVNGALWVMAQEEWAFLLSSKWASLMCLGTQSWLWLDFHPPFQIEANQDPGRQPKSCGSDLSSVVQICTLRWGCCSDTCFAVPQEYPTAWRYYQWETAPWHSKEVIFPGLVDPMVVVAFSDESLISRNLDYKWKEEINVSGDVAVNISADKWPVVTKRWLYIFWV